jgi:hypothetical protein
MKKIIIERTLTFYNTQILFTKHTIMFFQESVSFFTHLARMIKLRNYYYMSFDTRKIPF